MTAARFTSTSSRWNVGGYGALVTRWHREHLSPDTERWILSELSESRAVSICVEVSLIEQAAEVTADGSLSVEPEPWHGRHYRRAVMGGAGVYQVSLRAFLLAGRPVSPPIRLTERHDTVMSDMARTPHSLGPRSTLKTEYACAPLVLWATKLSRQRGLIDSLNSIYISNSFSEISVSRHDSKFNRDNQVFIKRLERLTQAHLNYVSIFAITFDVFFKSSAKQSYRAGYRRYLAVFLYHLADKLTKYADTHDELRERRPNLYARFWHWDQLQSISARGLAFYKARLELIWTLYRAHLKRRVKPAPRRHRRIRRPLHSRPKPPSAPLAPPVL